MHLEYWLNEYFVIIAIETDPKIKNQIDGEFLPAKFTNHMYPR